MPVSYEQSWSMNFNIATSVTIPGVQIEVAGASGKRIKIRRIVIQDGTAASEILVRVNSTKVTGGTPQALNPKTFFPKKPDGTYVTPSVTGNQFTGVAPTEGNVIADVDNFTTAAAPRDIAFGEGGGLLAPVCLESATDTLTIKRVSGASAAFRGTIMGTEEPL
jgi:hypothetical protein